MSNSSKRKRRRLADVLPPPKTEIQANFCRNPRCWNFGIAPLPEPRRKHKSPDEDLIGYYSLVTSAGGTALKCSICGRTASMISNVALAAELTRLRTANGILTPDSCPDKLCENRDRPAHDHPGEYHAHGRTRFGSERLKCKRCKSTLTLGSHFRAKTGASVNKDIVLDLVNRGALRAIMRKCSIGANILYDRIDFIHEQMVAFEAFKLQQVRRAKGKHRRHFSLATDGQDHQVNWATRFRRYGIKVSTISTADNLTGFVFRTDVNFDPTTGDVVKHLADLLSKGDFEVEDGLGLSRRYALQSFFRAVRYALRARRTSSPDPRDEYLLSELNRLAPDTEDDNPTTITSPIHGVMVSNMYTAIAHFMLIAETLPPDADVHIMTDPDFNFVAATPVGLKELLSTKRADLTFVHFNKDVTTPGKQQRVADYKRKLEEFAAGCDPKWDATQVRHAFIDQYAIHLPKGHVGVQASWWRLPVQTKYEPDRCVGIFYQRPIHDPEQDHQRTIELLDRSSLHSVDSFFNVMRQRVSFFHRAGLSRSSQSFYNAFQPYRPDMVQKIVDIARVYFNWVDPRPFRLSRKFEGKVAKEHSNFNEKLEKVSDENERRERREAHSTPAMRMRLAKSPVRLETIVYMDWRSKLFPSQRSTVRIRPVHHIRPYVAESSAAI